MFFKTPKDKNNRLKDMTTTGPSAIMATKTQPPEEKKKYVKTKRPPNYFRIYNMLRNEADPLEGDMGHVIAFISSMVKKDGHYNIFKLRCDMIHEKIEWDKITPSKLFATINMNDMTISFSDCIARPRSIPKVLIEGDDE